MTVNVCISETNGDSEPQQSKNYYKNFGKKETTTQMGEKAALHQQISTMALSDTSAILFCKASRPEWNYSALLEKKNMKLKKI